MSRNRDKLTTHTVTSVFTITITAFHCKGISLYLVQICALLKPGSFDVFWGGCKVLRIELQGNSEIKDGFNDRLHRKYVPHGTFS